MSKIFKAPLMMVVFVTLITMTGTTCLAEGYKNISPQEVKKMLREADPQILLLDVRTPGEYRNEGHLKGSKLIPINVIEARIKEIESYKDKNIIVYCKSGGRSSRVSNLLTSSGFTKIYNMSGGIDGWKRLGYEVE